MRRIRVLIAALWIGGILLAGAPSYAQDWRGEWVPIYEDYARGWGSNRAFWWSDLGPSPYWGGTSFDSSLGWPYNTWYGPAETYTYRVVPATPGYAAIPAPVVTARSVAIEGLGMHCSTPVKICLLKWASTIGAGCACKVTGGPAQGSVTP